MRYLLLLTAALTASAAEFPAPATDLPGTSRTATAVFAGGCFWGVEAVFESLQGVSEVTSGYAGGAEATAHYEEVGSGRTGHAESVRITYDPAKVSYGKLLQIFFSVAHDPTELNRQGPDVGTQYRSAVFYSTPEEKQVAEAYIRQLNQAKIFPRPIVTQLTALHGFYPAEAYHQDFIQHNPDYPYVVYNDLPKLKQLQEKYPAMVKHR